MENQQEARVAAMTGPGLNLERILAAAMMLADSAGFDKLSMRNLASSLGVKAMSLYNHVESRDALIDQLVDKVIAEIVLPEPSMDWKTAMWSRALSAHGVLLCHPWATMAIVSRVNTGPAMLGYIEGTLACLIRAGFNPEDADHVWNALDSYLYGYTLQELNFPFKAGEYREAAAAYLPGIPEGLYPHFVGLGHRIINGSYDGLHDLEFGLAILLDGLERGLVQGQHENGPVLL
jgi:AcrR family transcriptional regulator